MTKEEQRTEAIIKDFKAFEKKYAALKAENERLKEQPTIASINRLVTINELLQAEKAELLAFLKEVDDKVKLGNLNLKSYYLLSKHEAK